MLLIVLFILFLLSRLFTLMQAGSLWFDEAFSVHVASQPWSHMTELLALEHNPWGHFLILRDTIALVGSADWMMRLPSLFAGIATFFLLYSAGKKFFNSSQAGLGASFFLTISTLHLYHQTEARMYAFVAVFAALSTLCAWMWLQEQSIRKRYWLVAYLLSSFLLIHLHLTAWLYVIALAVAMSCELHHRQGSMRMWIGANSILFATGLLWFVPIAIYRFTQPSSAAGWFFSQQEQGYAFTHLVNFLLNGESNLLARSVCALLVIALLVSTFFRFDRPTWWQKITHPFSREEWPFSVAFHWTVATRLLLMTFILTMGMGFAVQITVTKYLLSASIPLFLLLGYGLSKLSPRMKWFVVMAFVALALPTHVHLLTPRHHWDVVARDVEQLKAEHGEAVVLVHSFAYTLPLQRYLSSSIDVIPVYPLQEHESLDFAIAKHNWQGIISPENIGFIDEQIGSAPMIILVSSTPGHDIDDPVKAHLWQNGWKLVERLHYNGYGDPEVLLLSR